MSLILGNSNISKLYLGDTEIYKVYLGSNIIYNKKHINKKHINTNIIQKIKNINISDEGIANNFSATDYIKIINSNYLIVNQNINWVLDITTNDDITTEQVITQCPGVYTNVQLCIQGGYFKYWSSDIDSDGIQNDGWWNIKQIQPNTNYIIKMSFPDTTSIKFEEYSNENWNELTVVKVIELENETMGSIGRVQPARSSGNDYFKGSINLANSYVQLDISSPKEYLYTI